MTPILDKTGARIVVSGRAGSDSIRVLTVTYCVVLNEGFCSNKSAPPLSESPHPSFAETGLQEQVKNGENEKK